MVIYWIGLALVLAATGHSLFIAFRAPSYPPVITDFGPIVVFFNAMARRSRVRELNAAVTALGFLVCSVGLPGIFAPVIYGVGAGALFAGSYGWHLRRKFWLAHAKAIEDTAASLLDVDAIEHYRNP